MSIRETREVVANWAARRRGEVATRILDQIAQRLEYLGQIGLDYLSLDRPGRSLSGGELRRVTMTRTLGSGLVNTLYVLDEPTIGLHPARSGRLIAVLGRLRDAGNTLVVVEHDYNLIRAADHLVDLGPGAGEAGGQLLYAGSVEHFSTVKGSLTERFPRRPEARGDPRVPTFPLERVSDNPGCQGPQPQVDRCWLSPRCSLRRDGRQRRGQEHAWSRRRSTPRFASGSIARRSPLPPTYPS